MIRSTLTAHLADADRQELTLQVNDRDIGVLATQEQRHYVMSGNRRVQLIAGLQTDPEDQASVMATRALLRQWLVTFRELQINGLSRFPVIADRNRLDADFLLLLDSDHVLVWCPENYAVYLHRGRHLYRQQPTYVPAADGLAPFSRKLDFYAFRPREGDDLLVIDPSFIDLFDAHDLEELLADVHQINVAMTELTRLALSYGREVDTSWFSAQIQRLEADLEMLSADSRERVAGKRGVGADSAWLSKIRFSKVVPLLDGNVRITPSGYARAREDRASRPAQAAYRPKAPEFKTSWQQGQPEEPRSLRMEEKRSRGAADLPDHYRRSPGFLDRLKHWNADGLKKRLGRWHYRLTHLVPGSRGQSLLAYIALWLVVLVLLVAGFTLLKKSRNSSDNGNDRPKVTTPATTAEAPKTDFEIDITVKASSLRVVTRPDGDELVGTVTRGDKVVQLTNAQDGWVLIRLTDGRTGYVPETLLLFPDDEE